MHDKPDEHPPLQLERLPPVGPPSCARSREGTKNNRKMMQTDDAILSNDRDVNVNRIRCASIPHSYNQLLLQSYERPGDSNV